MTSTTERKHRGTIIVDTNVLYDLRTEIPPEFTGGVQTHRRFMEILPFLGRNGFDIYIPEEVVFEITRHIVRDDGATLKNLELYIGPGKFPERKGFIHSFTQILNNQVPGIFILPSDQLNSKGGATVLSQIRDILEAYPNPQDMDEKTRKKLVLLVTAPGVADKVIAEQVRQLRKENSNEIIFDLSNDRNHEGIIAHQNHSHPNVKILDTTGLVRALVNNGLMPQFGVEPQIPYQTIVAHMNKRHEEYTGSKDKKHREGMVDSSCESGPTKHGFLNDCPFAEKIKTILS